jgi:hypothetical protein
MTPDEAKLLAAWLRKAAEWSDSEAERLHNSTVHTEAKFYVDQAARIRALADRLEGA